jgi:hypothetical protein
MGTAVGNSLYAGGGWVRSGSASVGFAGAALVICFARGPWENGWMGWRGGWSLRRRDLEVRDMDEEKRGDATTPENQSVMENAPKIVYETEVK